jgi:acyl-CoA thioester hydrolase
MTVFHSGTPIEIQYSDLDPHGHLNNARYFTCMDHGRPKYLTNRRLPQPETGLMGRGQIVAEATCAFKRPVRLGEVVDIAVGISAIGAKSLIVEYELSAAGRVAAAGPTIRVAYDYDSGGLQCGARGMAGQNQGF